MAFALRNTASHVAQYCRELRMGTPLSANIAERAFANRSLRLRRDAERGTISVTVDLPLDTGELIEKALDKARDDECLKIPDLVDTSWSTRQADAFVTMLMDYLIEHWSNGGETKLDNLMLLCTKHHTLVHEGGFRIDKDYDDDWRFYRPDGIAVPDCGYHARDMVDDDAGERYENPPRGGLLSAMEKLVNEPPPPQYLY